MKKVTLTQRLIVSILFFSHATANEGFINRVVKPESIVAGLATCGIIMVTQKLWDNYFKQTSIRLQPASPELARTHELLNQVILPTLTFKKLAGPVPLELQEAANFYHDLKTLQDRGITPPRSILLTGPAGTGKTTLAYAFAGEIESCIIPVSGTQLAGNTYEEGARLIRSLFETTKSVVRKGLCKKVTLIFDTLDFSKHLLSYQYSIHELVRQIKNLENNAIFVIATLQNFDKNDEILKKFDRIVELELPGTEQRSALLSHFAQSIHCSKNLDFFNLATATKGFTCQDLKATVQKAAIEALRNKSEITDSSHFMKVIEQIFATKRVSDKENMIFTSEDSAYTFSNVAGTVSEEVREITHFIKNAKDYTDMGAHMPKGILLVGPPGCGKTSIARAIAGETGASFFSISGSQFVEKYVGAGPQKIRELFSRARSSVKIGPYKKALIFIDEIDAIGGIRYTVESGADAEYRNTLTELLNQMDGFMQDDSLFVIAATNRIHDLDPALKRPGRFDRIIGINLPDAESRASILKHYTSHIKAEPSIEFIKLAQQTESLSGADLENLVNEAAIIAVREGAHTTRQAHFEKALHALASKN